MSYFLIYLIKSTVYLGLFYAFFLVAMRSTTFFRFNRVMLLLGTFVCMLLPCYTITVNEVEGIQLPMQILDEMLVLKTTDEQIKTSAIELPLQEAAPTVSTSLLPIVLLGIYVIGMLAYWFMVIRSFTEVWKMIASHPKQWKDGCWLVIIPEKIPSFSWSNYIVISEEDYRNYPQVLVHERMHYLCRHSYDILFFTIVHALHWFNPMVWLIRTELKQLHEFEADQGVINQGIDATQYQILLVKKAVGKKLYNIANGFNHTKLQKRITMMIQEKTNGWERLKWLVTVPVVMGAMLVFAQPEVKDTLEEVASTVNQQSSNEEIASLKKFFKEEQIKTENDIENLITAQTNSKCLVTYNEDSIEVILPKETLNEKSVVKIKDIIISKTKLSGWMRGIESDVLLSFQNVPRLKHVNLSVSTSDQMIKGKFGGKKTREDIIEIVAVQVYSTKRFAE